MADMTEQTTSKQTAVGQVTGKQVTGEQASDEPYCSAIINEKAGYCYMNIPKAACTSIKLAIARHMGLIKPKSDRLPPEFIGPSECHVPLSEVVNRTDIFRFSFSRHPADRAVSCWLDWTQPPTPQGLQSSHHQQLAMLHGCSFRGFISWAGLLPDPVIDDHMVSQTAFLHYGNTKVTDRVYRFESIQSDWEKLRKKFGLPPLPHVRKCENRLPWPYYYSSITRKILHKRYELDFKNLGYDWAEYSVRT